jgi:hypothetical protein
MAQIPDRELAILQSLDYVLQQSHHIQESLAFEIYQNRLRVNEGGDIASDMTEASAGISFLAIHEGHKWLKDGTFEQQVEALFAPGNTAHVIIDALI